MSTIDFAERYVAELAGCLRALPRHAVGKIVDLLAAARDARRQVFTCGNGGSAATASHLANDLAKTAIRSSGERFRAICLCDNIPLMLAWANDTAYERIFAEQLKNLLTAGDVVIGISGSGNSPNVLNAVAYANQQGAVTVGFTGMGGGKLATISQYAIVVDSRHMGMVEDVHLALVHLITYALKDSAAVM